MHGPLSNNVGEDHWLSKMNFSFCKFVKFLVLVLLPQVISKHPIVHCSIGHHVPILHKYYQSGDLIIAGIMSQIFIFSNTLNFEKHPSLELSDDHM